MTTNPRDGDVVSYNPDRGERHCREGMAVAQGGRFFDTFWGGSGDRHLLTESEVATAKLLFNTGDYDELDQYGRGVRLEWEQYAPEDRRRATSQHGLQARWFIRKGASKDLPTQIENARERLADARAALDSAQWRVKSAERELAELESVSPPAPFYLGAATL